jgi:glyceraldehyde 3-phosphate dehydrogenase
MNIAINGFGRIGRLVLRAFFETNKKYSIKIVAINDLLDIDTAIHLLKYDSVHGKFNVDVQKISNSELSINEHRLVYLSCKSPDELPWKNLKIDIVLECTGVFNKRNSCMKHLSAGAKKVLISSPASDVDKTVVFGVNSDSLDKTNDIIISNASCTTNCLAPIVKAIHDEIGILNGLATTIHSYTGDQRLVDMNHRDLRRSRAAALNMIPTSTGATNAIEKIFPELAKKLSGLSIRVPTPNVSLLDFSFTAARDIAEDDINAAIVRRADSDLNGIMGYTYDSLVSCDFNHDIRSAIVDLPLTKVVDRTVGRIIAWYDNEWGFSHRMLDVAEIM